jgi:hypothetical protein
VGTGSANRNIDEEISSLQRKSFNSSSTLSVVTRLHYGNSTNDTCLIIYADILFAIGLLSGARLQAWAQRRCYRSLRNNNFDPSSKLSAAPHSRHAHSDDGICSLRQNSFTPSHEFSAAKNFCDRGSDGDMSSQILRSSAPSDTSHEPWTL